MNGDGGVLVSGAGGQLGEAIVDALAARGARMVLTDVSADALAGPVSRAGDRVLAAVPADCRRDADVERLVAEAMSRAPITSCVIAAGVEGPVGPTERLDIAAVADVYDVNVFAPLRLVRLVVPEMRRRGSGRIVAVASGAGLAGSAHMAAYSSSKHALVGLMRSLAREVAPDGLSVNAICPGCIASPMMERIESALGGGGSGAGEPFLPAIPAGRYAEPSEVAELTAYLALEAPAYLTGAALVIDGALYA